MRCRPAEILGTDLADRLPREAGADLAAIEAETQLADLVDDPADDPLEDRLEDRLERLLPTRLHELLAQSGIRDDLQVRPLALQLDLDLGPVEEARRRAIPGLMVCHWRSPSRRRRSPMPASASARSRVSK